MQLDARKTNVFENTMSASVCKQTSAGTSFLILIKAYVAT